jgi:cyclic pyranopterin phosphate synthase
LPAAQFRPLTIYNMGKAIDCGMVIEEVRVLEKHGGRSEAWVAPPGSPVIGSAAT